MAVLLRSREQASIPESNDPYEKFFTIVVIVVIFMVLYLVRKRRFKNNSNKRHKEDIRDWGGVQGGPIGDPRDK